MAFKFTGKSPYVAEFAKQMLPIYRKRQKLNKVRKIVFPVVFSAIAVFELFLILFYSTTLMFTLMLFLVMAFSIFFAYKSHKDFYGFEKYWKQNGDEAEEYLRRFHA